MLRDEFYNKYEIDEKKNEILKRNPDITNSSKNTKRKKFKICKIKDSYEDVAVLEKNAKYL